MSEGGTGSRAASADPDLIALVRAAARRSRRVATVCTGTFIAAAAGLIDGRHVTTHWAHAQELQAQYPALDVDPDPLYIRDGRVWTSAGVTAGIDLALAMVADDLGTDVAQTLARWLVMFLHRPDGQSPGRFVERVRFEAARADLEAGDDTLDVVAERCGLGSAESLRRVFHRHLGVSPDAYRRRFSKTARHEGAPA